MLKQMRRPSLPSRWIITAAAFGVAVSLLGTAPGEDITTPQDDNSTPPGVSVPDSPGASERMDKARDKELQKQWKTAAELYQETLTKYPGRVLPVLRDPDKGIFQYAGVSLLVQERISKWPAEGLAIYRGAYGQIAADALTAVPRGNTAGLESIFWNYFPTDAGKTAGLRLIDANLERGDFQAALWFGNRLLNWHPALTTDRGAVIYRAAMAAYRAGDMKQAEELLNHLKKECPTDIASVAGKDVSLVDSLTAMLASPPPAATTRPSDADTYPSFGGIGGRGDISTSSARPGASLNSITLTKPSAAGLMNQALAVFPENEKETKSNNLAMGIIPVVDAGSLFFQDGRSIYAVDADSGAPLPAWSNTYSGDHGGRYRMNVPGRVRNEPTTITVTPTAVLAVMGQPDRMSFQGNNFNAFNMQGMPNSTPGSIKLICLDRDTGRELWTKTTAELPEPAAGVRTGSYCGTPLMLPANITGTGEDSVMVIARGGAENQFDDCYAICLSLKTGQYQWSTYLGSATRSYSNQGPIGEPAQTSLANDRVFVMTNLGSVVSLNPADGRIIWLNSYARDGVINTDQMMLNARRFGNGMQQPNTSTSGAWAHNPVFVSDGTVFVLPRDAKELFVYDAGSGAEKNRIPMVAYDNANLLLGVRDGDICLTSLKGIYVVNWKKYQDGDQSVATRWKDVDVTKNSEHSDICGRGFVTSESVFIPTKNRLIQKSWKSGKILQNYPKDGKFEGDEGPGNILVTAHNVIVAGQTQVNVYTDLLLVRQRFESAIAAAPTDPEPRMGYADALVAGGDFPGAITHVDEAIDLIGGMNAMRLGKPRERIFSSMLAYTARIERNKGTDNDPQGIASENKFYDRAVAAAESPVQNARYRLARASFDHAHGDYAGEVQLCQEVLSDDAMRNAMISDELSAGASAESTISLATSMDRSVYAPIEQKAADAYKTARDNNDPDQLLAVATVYPNSNAAINARQDAVHRFEAANQPDRAISILRTMYTSSNDIAKKVDLLVSITNDFLAMPEGVGPALDRLCRASRLSPNATLRQKLRLPDGTTLGDLTFADAITKLRQLHAEQENARLPDFHLAIPEVGTHSPFIPGVLPKIENVLSLVHPLHEFDRADQILTWGATGLCIYPAGATTPAATISQVDKSPLAAAWISDHWLVWTNSDVYQIDARGNLTWDFPVTHLTTLAVSADSDTLVNVNGDNPNDGLAGANGGNVGGNVQVFNGQFRVRGNGRVMMRMNGMVIQPPVPAPPPVAHTGDEQINAVTPGADRVLISTTSGRLLALDFRSGQTVWQTRPMDHAIDQLQANAHFTVARMDDPGGSQVAVYDTPTGRKIGGIRFGPDNTPTQLVNTALSEEGTLAFTLFSQLMVKDLYDPWKDKLQPLIARSNPDTAPYLGLSDTDQLLVHGGRVACLYDAGSQARGYDLSTVSDPTDPKATGTSTNAVSMRMVGPRLFIVTPKEFRQYNLQDISDCYEATIGQQDFIPKVHGMLLGKDYAVSINDPVDRGPVGQPRVFLGGFRRTLHAGKNREWGDFDYLTSVSSPAGIMDWVGADGGVYYLTKDGSLYLKRGARP